MRLDSLKSIALLLTISCIIFSGGALTEASASFTRSDFDTLYNRPELAVIKTDMQTLGYGTEQQIGDLIYTVLVAWDQVLAAMPNDPAAFSWPDFKNALTATLTKQQITDKKHQEIIARLANMFWVELVLAPPWHLTSLGANDLRNLYFPILNDPVFLAEDYGKVTRTDFKFWPEIAAPDNTSSFTPLGHFAMLPLAWKIVAGATDSQEAAKRLAAWEADNVFHPYAGIDPSKENWDNGAYTKYPLVDTDVFYPGSTGYYDIVNLFAERITGCHLAARLLKALATSVNIPALAGQIDYPPNPHGGHGATYFTALDMFAHGDWMADHIGITPDAIIMPTQTFIDALANAGGDYLVHWSAARQQSGNNLALRRIDNTLFVSGTFEVCPADKDAALQRLNDLGFTFTCAAADQPTLTGCAAERCTSDENMVPIRTFETLITDWRPVASTTTTTLSGTVTSSLLGYEAGVKGAQITVTGNGQTYQTTTADQTGNWQIGNIPNGTYSITITAASHAPLSSTTSSFPAARRQYPWPAAACRSPQATPLRGTATALASLTTARS